MDGTAFFFFFQILIKQPFKSHPHCVTVSLFPIGLSALPRSPGCARVEGTLGETVLLSRPQSCVWVHGREGLWGSQGDREEGLFQNRMWLSSSPLTLRGLAPGRRLAGTDWCPDVPGLRSQAGGMTTGFPPCCAPGPGLHCLAVPGACGCVDRGVKVTVYCSSREEARLRRETTPLPPYSPGQRWGGAPPARHVLLPPEETRGCVRGLMRTG